MHRPTFVAGICLALVLLAGGCVGGAGDEGGETGRGGMAGLGATDAAGGRAGRDATGGQTGRDGSGGAPGTGGQTGRDGNGGAPGQGGHVVVGGAGGAPNPLGLCRMELTCATPIVDEPKVTCGLTIADPAGVNVYDGAAGVELRGRSSLEYPKQNYGVELRTATGDESPVAMMGMGKEADWIFDGSWLDRSFMRNDLVFALYRDMGRYAPESRFCTLRLNGQPRGIYRLSEKIKRDDDRVAIAADDGTGKSFIISQDEDGVFELPVGTANKSAVWELVYPKQETASAAVRTAVQTWLDGLRRALTGSDPGHAVTGVLAFLDLDSTVDFILVEELSKNVDAYNLSLTLFRSDGGRAAFVPWDFDLSFGQPTTRTAGNDAPSGWIQGRTAFINNLCRVPAVLARLGTRWRELRAGTLSDAHVLAKLDAFQAVLSAPATEENFAIWPIAEVDFQEIYRPYSLYRVSSYSEEVARFREWIRARLAWIDAHIDTYPN